MASRGKRKLVKNGSNSVINEPKIVSSKILQDGEAESGTEKFASETSSKYFKNDSGSLTNDHLESLESDSGDAGCNLISKTGKSSSATTQSPATTSCSASSSATSATATAREKLGRGFYDVPCEDLAKSLLGAIVVRRLDDGKLLRGRIVETESYLGGEDHASHSYRGRRTPKTEPMYMTPGTAYVYSIHTYVCMNISSQGEGAAVLIRALEPLCEFETMRGLRGRRRSDAGVKLKQKEFTNGPSKLTEAFDITKEDVNKLDLADNDLVWIEKGETVPDDGIVRSARININCDQVWKDAKLRFYIKGNPCVSVRDRAAEKFMSNE